MVYKCPHYYEVITLISSNLSMVKFISGDKLFDIDFFYVYNFQMPRYSRRRNVKLLFLNVKKIYRI